ncbi:predicted protein [Nematostella vectensis]|uniref:Large ribosomal subunit protein mL37 n=1 Tax=Nematostella vectensis TaxID=45351 RepID=A7S9U2_NEMVE|nr:uncharacterized protein LOC5511195 isoform X1 [Nematostella vectensis]XP_048583227.1 uncharacterized protein LOC5511195 isoform X2 [Nematostella vectensis]EDO39571.1 predicted protein [Nematostella vectensis]|eukprot:XP_001631634.1 predicted protein [Nematostella vectensis]
MSALGALAPRLLGNTTKRYLPPCLTRFFQTLVDENPSEPIPASNPVRGEFAPKAFIILPEHQSRDLEQNLWLTKTAIQQSLPLRLGNAQLEIPETALRDFSHSFLDSLRQKFGFQREEFRRRSLIEEELNLGVLLEVLRSCMSYMSCAGSRYSHLRESFLDRNPQIITHWSRGGSCFQVKTKPSYVLWTRYPVELFSYELDTTLDTAIPGPYKPNALDVYAHKYVPLKNVPGCVNRQQSLYPYCHTMLLTCVNQSATQMQSNGILNMFSLLLSHALDDGRVFGSELSSPIATKCIVTDGTKYIFMCYQLNTLNFGKKKKDNSIKNMVWMTDAIQLFKKKSHTNHRKKTLILESVAPSHKLPGFNEGMLRTLISFLCDSNANQ